MGFAQGWFRMTLEGYWEEFPLIVLGFCGFLEKNRKNRKPKPQHRELTQQRGMPSPQQGRGAQKGTPRVR